ncbi:harmonin-like isoform X4 [Ruditapes philippinarum]|uniref:harmonin-like isoform X4 n=1 Tax=Ruditapes philippinarum TaxID=129788 RepID=UPI00295AA32D|nr:harmonin-like isoform X4 [Ruditapes philippinarum]
MESKLIKTFTSHVNELITSEQERDHLFDALKKYQTSSDVIKLVSDLKRLINEPTKLEIYDTIRPLIRPQHQQQYDKLAPNSPGQKLRVIKLRRRTSESFGFAVRGGFEHGVGIFVSHVEPGSQAEMRGLKMGDEIVRVNGFTIGQAIHEEVLNLIKGRDEIELKVTNIGMVPIKQKPSDPVTWQYVDKPGSNKSQAIKSSGSENESVVKIFINLHGAPSLGCSIISGPTHFPGIFIESVRPGSLGEDYNLEVGDQIMEVNGKSFEKIKHKEAIVELKGSKELNMIIKKSVGLPLLNLKKKNVEGSPVPVRKETSNEQEPIQLEDSGEVICEILEEDLYAKVEKKHWAEEQEKLRKEKAEEAVREQLRQQKKLEEEQQEREEQERRWEEQERRRREEEERMREEEHMRELEELRIQEEEKHRAEQRKNEEKRKKEEAVRKQKELEERKRQEIAAKKQQVPMAKKRREKEKDFYRQVQYHKNQLSDDSLENYLTLSQSDSKDSELNLVSAVLAGRSGPSNSMKPTLLGAAPGAQTSFGSSGNTKEVEVILEDGTPLDIELEGGTGSPLGGKIVICEVYPGGSVDKSGGIRRGDQIVEVNGISFQDISLTEANEKIWQVEQECLPGDGIKFVVIESGLNDDDETTFF